MIIGIDRGDADEVVNLKEALIRTHNDDIAALKKQLVHSKQLDIEIIQDQYRQEKVILYTTKHSQSGHIIV